MPAKVHPPELEFRSAEEFSLAALAAAANRCFTGYLVPVHVDVEALAQMLRVDSVNLAASTLVQRADQVIGVALVARRGGSCRLAAMAIEPDARGCGVGRALTEFLLRAARERSDRQFALEVIEQNAAGMRLYEMAGFQRIRRLVGYSAANPPGQNHAELAEIDPPEAGSAVAQWGVGDLPWQLSAQTVAALSPPHRAFRLGPARAVIGNPDHDTLIVRSLVVASDERRRGWGTRLIQAVSARYPRKKWRVPVWVPEEIPATFFAQLGFTQEQMTQFQMSRRL